MWLVASKQRAQRQCKSCIVSATVTTVLFLPSCCFQGYTNYLMCKKPFYNLLNDWEVSKPQTQCFLATQGLFYSCLLRKWSWQWEHWTCSLWCCLVNCWTPVCLNAWQDNGILSEIYWELCEPPACLDGAIHEKAFLKAIGAKTLKGVDEKNLRNFLSSISLLFHRIQLLWKIFLVSFLLVSRIFHHEIQSHCFLRSEPLLMAFLYDHSPLWFGLFGTQYTCSHYRQQRVLGILFGETN